MIAAGSSDDGYANVDELITGFSAVGAPLQADKATLSRLIAIYSQSGNGALDATELARARGDGAFDVGADTATINTSRLQPQTPQDGQNIATRVIGAGSTDDALVNRGELRTGLAAAGWDLPQSEELDYVITAFSGGVGALTAEQLVNAIAVGAIVLHQDGSVTIDPTKAQATGTPPMGEQDPSIVEEVWDFVTGPVRGLF